VKKILIVDDMVINRKTLKGILNETYEVLEAENGKVALEILEKNKETISLIFLDIIMPVMNGYEFLKIQQANPELAKIPVIVATSEEGDKSEINALSLGASDFISKAYNPNIIRQRISNTIRMRESFALINLVERDILTGLYTKEAFYPKIEEILKNDQTSQYAIIYFDFENFSLVNDMFGEETGDRLLTHFGKVLERALKHINGSGYACRLSGDTFAVFMMESWKDIETDIVNPLNEAIAKFDIAMRLTLDMGIYEITDHNESARAMCDKAKNVIRLIKGKYDQQYIFYDKKIDEISQKEQMIASEMQTALDEGQFVVYFQPKFELSTLNLCGAEALVRWIHPERGFMSPNQFIPLFERNGFITKLDYFVWEKACQLQKKHLENHEPIVPISVNVSRVDIFNPHLVQMFKDLLAKYQLPHHLIHIEITETAYTSDQEQMKSVTEDLKKANFIIEMDDFGSGYSSLTMLDEISVDILKLDMNFLKHDTLRKRNQLILKHIVSLADALEFPTICEGVETKEDINYLLNVGCIYGQGYYYSKPLPEKAFEAFIAKQIITDMHLPNSTIKVEDKFKKRNVH